MQVFLASLEHRGGKLPVGVLICAGVGEHVAACLGGRPPCHNGVVGGEYQPARVRGFGGWGGRVAGSEKLHKGVRLLFQKGA